MRTALSRSLTPDGFDVEIARYRGAHLASSAVISDRTEFSDMFLLEGAQGVPLALSLLSHR